MNDLMELVKDCDTLPASGEDTAKIEAARAKATNLHDLGLLKVAQHLADKADLKYRLKRVADGKYVRITNEKIQAFLERRARQYDEGRQVPTEWGMQEDYVSLGDVFQEWRRYGNSVQIDPAMVYYQTNGTTVTMRQHYRHLQQELASQEIRRQQQVVEGPSLEARTKDFASMAKNTLGRFRWVEVPVANYDGIPPEHVLLRLAEEKQKGIFQEYHVASVENIHDPLLLGIVKGCEDRFFLSQWGDDVSLDDVI